MICFEGLRIAGGNSGASNASTISLGGVRYRGAVCWPVCANCAVEAVTMNAAANASVLFSMSKTSCGVRQVILKRPDSIRRENVELRKARLAQRETRVQDVDLRRPPGSPPSDFFFL